MKPEDLKELDRLYEYYLSYYHHTDAMAAARMKLRGEDPLVSSLSKKFVPFECCGGIGEE